MGTTTIDALGAADAVNRLVDEYRVRCLWFLRLDYYPATLDERLRVLSSIERHGDREAFRRAAALKQWLSHPSNVPSANSWRRTGSRLARATSRAAWR